MASLHTSEDALPSIPDNVTISQFMLDEQPFFMSHSNTSCLIDDKSGQSVSLEELRDDTHALAAALQSRYNLGENSISMIISPNHIDYPVSMWAIHRLGGIITFSNPQFTADELAYQLEVARVTFIIVHSAVLQVAVSAAQLVNLPLDRVILLDHTTESLQLDTFRLPTVRELIIEGHKWKSTIKERMLAAGEGKSKIALLCWSSGTTGKPKAVAISHYAFIANIIQMAVHNHVGSDHSPYRPGDIALGALPFFHVAGLVINLHFVLFCGVRIYASLLPHISSILTV
ncbi:hypothetical protein BDQ17DRAFT_346272 [Cyathus striatus]|nr:hypothetical protein BDQ17DRAFT_346272 [Cyathus striatus]